MVKSIIVVVVVVVNLDLTSPFRPKKLRAGKGYLTQAPWVWQSCVVARPK